jgi:hypothetical protein
MPLIEERGVKREEEREGVGGGIICGSDYVHLTVPDQLRVNYLAYFIVSFGVIDLFEFG